MKNRGKLSIAKRLKRFTCAINGLLVLFFLICALAGVGQQREGRDYRSELNLSDGFPSFALSPDGNSWLVSGGHAYFTENILSDWHCATPLWPDDNASWIEVKQVSFLDSNTAIVATDDHFNNNDCYYRTEDRGKSWTRHPLGLVVPGRVARQLQDLGCQVFQYRRQVHRGPGPDPLGVVAFAEQPVHSAHGELEPGPRRAGLGLGASFTTLFATSRHDSRSTVTVENERRTQKRKVYNPRWARKESGTIGYRFTFV